jgi:hypothetical protein
MVASNSNVIFFLLCAEETIITTIVLDIARNLDRAMSLWNREPNRLTIRRACGRQTNQGAINPLKVLSCFRKPDPHVARPIMWQNIFYI